MTLTMVTLVLQLVVGLEIYIDVEREGCERTVQAIRQGARVTVKDNHGYAYDVERARCVSKPESLRVEPTS
jgi:phosphohistidine swiveling domain-containing protein